MTEEAFAAPRASLSAVGFEAPVLKKRYLHLVRSLANSVQ